MKSENILEQIVAIAEIVLKQKIQHADMQTRFEQIPRWNSLNHALIMNRVEKHFGIEFEIDELIAVESLGNICQLVENKMNTL